ncbi:MAG TPA: hypothetical protein VK420_15340, partial [Longimicrobium sp.]|nr:hypothetical protein [Longimicrobium sp.]
MPSSPIKAQERDRVDDRTGRAVACWEKRPVASGAAEPPWLPLTRLTPDEWQGVLQGATSLVVACTSRSPKLAEEVVTWATRTARIRTYLLAPEAWASTALLQSLLKGAGQRLLVRLAPEPPADWVVADRERGFLLAGAPGADRHWAVRLSAPLARTLHAASTHLFWNEARQESLPEGAGGARLATCLPSPFPKPAGPEVLLPLGSLAPRDESPRPLLPDAEVVLEPAGALPEAPPRLLLTPPGPQGFAGLVNLVERGSQVAWFDGHLPRMALTRRRMVLELGEGLHRLRLELEAQDAIRMMQALEARAQGGTWRFHASRALGAVAGPVWLEATSGEQPVHDELPLELGDVKARELSTVADTVPERWPEPAGLARRVRYRWRVVPPGPPPGARPAQLVRAWQDLDSHVEQRAREALRQLRELEQKEKDSGVLQRLKGLLARWDEVRSRRKRLQRGLEDILEQPLSRRPADARALVAELVAREGELADLERYCREAEEEEERKVEEERQRALHRERVEAARVKHGQVSAELETLRRQLREAIDGLAAAEEEARTRREELARAEHETRVNAARAKLLETQEELRTLEARRTELEQPPGQGGTDDEKARKKERHKVEEALKRLRGEETKLRQAAEAPFQAGAAPTGQDERLVALASRQKTLRADRGRLEA